MPLKSAKAAIRNVFPFACVVRGTFGLIVLTDPDVGIPLGEGRAAWDEEAWISAVESLAFEEVEATTARLSRPTLSPTLPN